MYDYLSIGAVALFASALTFFSGFGLGTLLTPVFIYFLPIELAIASTALVHFTNNLFKFILMKNAVIWKIVIKFGISAFIFAYFGAYFLQFEFLKNPIELTVFAYHFATSYQRMAIALLIAFFSWIEFFSSEERFRFSEKHLVFGGMLSGFFGGFSGHQGAFRSAFLIQLNLSKDAFVATGIAIALLVDLSRLTNYATFLGQSDYKQWLPYIGVAVTFAFFGAIIGKKLLKKITIKSLQILIALFMFISSIFIFFGII